jgi:peroxiredoxin
MDGWARRVEVATNVAVLLAFLLVGALAAKRLLEQSPSRRNTPSIGARISIRGVDWSQSKQNLVLALSTGCHFCSESAGFYRRLVPSAKNNGVRVLAVLPQSTSDSRSYLERLGVTVSEVVQSPLSAVEASGTPTILLVDGDGKIRKAWVGKLGPEQEQQVLARLN